MSPPESTVDPGSAPRSANGSVLFVVFTTILIDFIGFTVLIPVLPLYAARLNATPLQVGLILTSYALAQLLFLPAWGWFSDQVGRRPVLLVSLFGTAASFVLLAAADSIEAIYVARSLAGFFAASIGTAQAVVTDVTPPAERARGMGLIGAAFGAGMVVGPLLGGVLANVDAKLPFYAIAGLAIVNFGIGWFRLPETLAARRKHAPRARDLLRSLIPAPIRLIAADHDRRTSLYLYLFLHLFTAFAVLESMITLYLGKRFGAEELEIAGVFLVIGLVLAATQGLLLKPLVMRFGEPRLVAIGMLIMSVSLGAVPALPTFGWFYALAPLVALGNGLAFPSFTSLFSRVCDAGQAGELLAQSQAMITTGRVVAPIGAGFLMEYWSLETPFQLAAVMMLAGLAIFLNRQSLLIGE